MDGVIYTLCALTAFLCSWLLLRSYWESKYRLLLWGGFCFAGLTLNNLLVVMDKILIQEVDFSTWRLVAALVAMLVFLYGLVFETE